MSSVTVGMQTQCSRSLWVGLEASSRQRVRRLRMPDGRVCYVNGVVLLAKRRAEHCHWRLAMSETGMQQSTTY